jgi:hypothetical protein
MSRLFYGGKSACRYFATSVVVLSCALAPEAASAQPEAGSAKALFADLVVNRFIGGATNPQRTQDIIDEFSKSIAIGIATAPVGASSAGFSYEFDPRSGEHTLKSQSFGPLFVERPYTNGRGVFNLGVGYSYNSYSKFLDTDLDDGILLFDNRVVFSDNNFEQYIEECLSVDPRVHTVNVLASYGITRSLDIGVVVPISSLKLKARRYMDYDISRNYPLSERDRAFFTAGPRGTNFDPPGTVSNRGEVSKTGIGDVSVRAKYGFGAQGRRAAAAVVDVRLPTGDEDNLLGTGKTSTRLLLIGSNALNDTFSFHANGGYQWGGLTDQGDYSVALDAALLPSKKLTMSAELLGQYLADAVSDLGEIRDGPRPIFEELNRVNASYTAAEPQFLTGSVNNLRAAFGLKYNVGGTSLLTGGVIFPLTENGVTSAYTAFVGLDISLVRR